jgi:hypothetical protein
MTGIREGEAPAEPKLSQKSRLGRSLAIPIAYMSNRRGAEKIPRRRGEGLVKCAPVAGWFCGCESGWCHAHH